MISKDAEDLSEEATIKEYKATFPNLKNHQFCMRTKPKTGKTNR
jgi:hypothetical protein